MVEMTEVKGKILFDLGHAEDKLNALVNKWNAFLRL